MASHSLFLQLHSPRLSAYIGSILIFWQVTPSIISRPIHPHPKLSKRHFLLVSPNPLVNLTLSSHRIQIVWVPSRYLVSNLNPYQQLQNTVCLSLFRSLMASSFIDLSFHWKAPWASHFFSKEFQKIFQTQNLWISHFFFLKSFLWTSSTSIVLCGLQSNGTFYSGASSVGVLCFCILYSSLLLSPSSTFSVYSLLIPKLRIMRTWVLLSYALSYFSQSISVSFKP